MIRTTRCLRPLQALTLAALAACAATPSESASELVLVPWTGPTTPFQQQNRGGVDVAYEPLVTYAVFVPGGKDLWMDVPHGERWIVWARGLASGFSQIVLEGDRTSFPGHEVVLISVAYINGRADSPFFGSVIHVEDYPTLSVGSQKLRAVWERRGDAKDNLVLELNVR